ncbi:MAG: TolC family protein [Phycisphaeraceae bacterium]|nr:TolC family protein [Phycisphaeraceae bacterium]
MVLKHKKITVFLCLTTLVLCALAGCKKHDYKAEADRDVYGIINTKWQDDFGAKTNYTVSDTPALPNDVRVDRDLPNLGVLTLPQAVALATADNRAYQTEKETLYRQALDLRLSRHEFENRFFGGFGVNYNNDSNDAAMGYEANVGFNRLLANGTRIGARVAAAWVDVLTGNLRGGAVSLLGVSLVKPLMRNSDKDVVMENLTQKERDTLYQIRTFNRYRKTFVVSVITEYYQTLKLLDKAQNTRQYRESLVTLHDLTQKLVASGRVPKHELERLHQEVLQAHDRYLQEFKQYEYALDQFKLTLSIKASTPLTLDNQEFTKLHESNLVLPKFTEEEVTGAALTRRLDLANISDQVIDAQRKIKVTKDQLRAELNLTAGAELTSANTADPASLKAFDDRYHMGLNMNLPFDRMAEATAYRNAQLDLLACQRNYDQATTQITLDIREAYRKLVEAQQRHIVQTEALDTAQKHLSHTTVLLRHNRVSTRRVLQALSDLDNALNADSEALVNFTTAQLEFYRDTGILNVKPDGMWKL